MSITHEEISLREQEIDGENCVVKTHIIVYGETIHSIHTIYKKHSSTGGYINAPRNTEIKFVQKKKDAEE